VAPAGRSTPHGTQERERTRASNERGVAAIEGNRKRKLGARKFSGLIAFSCLEANFELALV